MTAFTAECTSTNGADCIHSSRAGRIPNFICGFALTGGKWNLIEIPDDVLAVEIQEQLELLPVLMLEYVERYRGECPFFGKITGFRYVRLLDYYQFDREGRFVQYVDAPFRRGTCSVSLSRYRYYDARPNQPRSSGRPDPDC